MNLLTSFEPNRGSGRSCILLAVNLRAMRVGPGNDPKGGKEGWNAGDGFRKPEAVPSPAALRHPELFLLGPALGRSGALGGGAVLGAGLLAVGHPQAVEHAADDVIAHAGQVADPTAPDQHDRVLLEVVPLAGDVRGDLLA